MIPLHQAIGQFQQAIENCDEARLRALAAQHPELLTDALFPLRDAGESIASMLAFGEEKAGCAAHYALSLLDPKPIRLLAKLGARFDVMAACGIMPQLDLTGYYGRYIAQYKKLNNPDQAEEAVRVFIANDPAFPPESDGFYQCLQSCLAHGTLEAPWLVGAYLASAIRQDNPDVEIYSLAQAAFVRAARYSHEQANNYLSLLAEKGLDFSQGLRLKKPNLTMHQLLKQLQKNGKYALDALFATGLPPLHWVIKDGRLTAPAQRALSVFGAEAFFTHPAWEGHSGDKAALAEAMKPVISPYWRNEIDKVMDTVAALRDSKIPEREVSVAQLSSAERGRDHGH